MGMTIDKAKSVINELKLYVEDLHSYSADDVSETLEFIIKALEQQPNRCDSCTHSEEQDGSNCYECIKGMADNFETQPTDADCISREEVMKCFKKWQPYMATRLWDYEQELKALPSVTPKGVTITDFADRCRECGKIKRCADCYYNDGEVHAECVICDKAESEDIE